MTTRTPLMTMTAVQALCSTAITKPDQFSQRVLALEDSASAETFKLDCCGDSAKCAPLLRELFCRVKAKFAGIWAQKQVASASPIERRDQEGAAA